MTAPWNKADIGAPVLSGGASQTNGVFSIDAAGEDIWNTNDQFHFVYQQIAGDVEVTARVRGLTATHPWAQADVMIRATPQGNSAHASALVSAATELLSISLPRLDHIHQLGSDLFRVACEADLEGHRWRNGQACLESMAAPLRG